MATRIRATLTSFMKTRPFFSTNGSAKASKRNLATKFDGIKKNFAQLWSKNSSFTSKVEDKNIPTSDVKQRLAVYPHNSGIMRKVKNNLELVPNNQWDDDEGHNIILRVYQCTLLVVFMCWSIVNLHKDAVKRSTYLTDEDKEVDDIEVDNMKGEPWKVEMKSETLTISSRPIADKNYLEYKVEGRYTDIPAWAYFYIQTNISDRKRWDSNTDIIESIGGAREDNSSRSELIYWRVNFPLMAKREYVFHRLSLIDVAKNSMMIINRAIDCPDKKPVDKKHVRVTDYTSTTLIQPINSFTQKGFTFTTTYVDDPKTGLPPWIISKRLKKDLPNFLQLVHKECKAMAGEYDKFIASGADIKSCSDERMTEMHHLFEKAKGKTTPGCENADMGRCSSAKRERYTVGELVKPISPPEYLPDFGKLWQMIRKEGRWRPIPYIRVHPRQPVHLNFNNKRTKMASDQASVGNDSPEAKKD